MSSKTKSEWIWYQEYKNCSCTEIRVVRLELLGYCHRHHNQPRRTVKLPRGEFKDVDLGFCEM